MTTEPKKKKEKISVKDQIFSSPDIAEETIEIPEWGNVKILLKELDGKDRDRWDKFEAERQIKALEKEEPIINNDGMKAFLIMLCAFDVDGQKLFDEADLFQLQSKSGVVLDRLYNECLQLSKLRQFDKEFAEKN